MDTVEIQKMNTVERLQAMEMLVHEEVEAKSPGWHQGTIKERMSKIDSGDVRFLSLQELNAR